MKCPYQDGVACEQCYDKDKCKKYKEEKQND